MFAYFLPVKVMSIPASEIITINVIQKPSIIAIIKSKRAGSGFSLMRITDATLQAIAHIKSPREPIPKTTPSTTHQ